MNMGTYSKFNNPVMKERVLQKLNNELQKVMEENNVYN